MSCFKEALRAEDATVESLLQAAEELDFDLYVIIHSIDVLLSSSCPKLKPILIDLMVKADGKIRLLASVDHVHSGLLFNTKETNKLNLVWFKCPTMDAYRVERCYASAIDANANSLMGHVSLSSIEHVYESLNPNAQKIFIQIVSFFLNNDDMLDDEEVAKLAARDDSDEATDHSVSGSESGDGKQRKSVRRRKKKTREQTVASGLPFSTLYRICREEYLVNSEITLKAQLTEFKDHKLIKFSKRTDGTQVINLLVTSKLAQKFLDKLEEAQ